jgi:hypothetical protein
MSRNFAVGFLCALVPAALPARAATRDDQQTVKKALQALNDYIGGWKGNGTVARNARETWGESADWAWRFKKKDVWLTVTVKKGRFLKGGELRYLPAKKLYQFTAIDKDDKKSVFEGKLKKGRLTLERKDPKTRETQQLAMNMAGGGIRFIYTVSHKPANRTLFTFDYQVAFTRKGETFGAREKKIECVVSGGLGTIAVQYKGVTYYVCCSGCKDAFNEDPEKYIKEYEAKKRKR